MCRGSAICEHNQRRSQCKECKECSQKNLTMAAASKDVEAIKLERGMGNNDVTDGNVITGTRLEVQFGDGQWYGGGVERVSKGGWASIKFDDGDKFMVQLLTAMVRREEGKV